jgi:hypothetical protein
VLDALADNVELALEGLRVGDARSAAYENLFNAGLGGSRARSNGRIVGRYPAPAEQRLAFLADYALHHLPAPGGLTCVARQEHEPCAVMLRGRQADAKRGALAGEEGVRHLDEDAGAVSRVDLAAAGPTVQQVLQDLERLADDGVGLPALDVHDEADAAGVVLMGWIVEALRFGHPARRRR